MSEPQDGELALELDDLPEDLRTTLEGMFSQAGPADPLRPYRSIAVDELFNDDPELLECFRQAEPPVVTVADLLELREEQVRERIPGLEKPLWDRLNAHLAEAGLQWAVVPDVELITAELFELARKHRISDLILAMGEYLCATYCPVDADPELRERLLPALECGSQYGTIMFTYPGSNQIPGAVPLFAAGILFTFAQYFQHWEAHQAQAAEPAADAGEPEGEAAEEAEAPVVDGETAE